MSGGFGSLYQELVIPLLVILVLILVLGRGWCSWLCPFGLLQELMYKLPLPKWRLPARLGWLRYVFLVILVFVIPYITLEPWFCKLCPQGTLEGGIPQILLHPQLRPLLGWLFALKIVILLAFLAWMAVTRRPFCRWVCPLGAVWSPFNSLSAVRLEVDRETCIECNRCQQVCPVDIRIYENADAVECVRCLEPFAYRLSFSLTDRFLPASEAAHDEDAFPISNDNSVDLSEPLREIILLSLPMHAVCRPDCRGLCPQCGQNLNFGQCDCQKEEIDPRLAILKQLL